MLYGGVRSEVNYAGDEEVRAPAAMRRRGPLGIRAGIVIRRLADGATLGRGDVEIRLEDHFASSRHARIIAPRATWS